VYWTWLAGLAVAAVSALAADSTALNGTVIDADTRLPVMGAQMALRYTGSSAHIKSTTSDKSGRFRLVIDKPGSYTVEAAAEGYSGTEFHSQQPSIKIDENELAENSTPAEREVTVSISRVVAITGQLKDGGTQKPLADFTIKALRISWFRGKRVFSAEGIVSTDEKGAFRVDATPGDYMLQIWKTPAANRIIPGRQPDYSEKSPVALGYPVVFWPRGDPNTVTPLSVRSGSDFGVGSINLSKIPAGRIRGRIPQCAEDETASVHFEMTPIHDRAMRGDMKAVCGSAFTVRDLSPGIYRIEVVIANTNDLGGFAYPSNGPTIYQVGMPASGTPLPNFGSADVRIEEGSDVDVEMTFEQAIDVAGKIECECADGWQAAIAGARIWPAPTGTISGRSWGETVGENNTFRMVGSFGGDAEIELDPMPKGMMLKQILSNGAITGDRFVPRGRVGGQSVKVVLTDRPAHLSGTIYREGKAEPGARVAVARWPLSTAADFPNYRSAECDDRGQFAMELAPGTYRVTGVDASEWGRAGMPDVLAGWIASGQEFTVIEDERRVLRIELKRPE
jgi:hypothetical protein